MGHGMDGICFLLVFGPGWPVAFGDPKMERDGWRLNGVFLIDITNMGP